ncbi:MAG: hypothetical protein ACKVZH_24395 [Blastocatellia bacterium]
MAILQEKVTAQPVLRRIAAADVSPAFQRRVAVRNLLVALATTEFNRR